MMHNTAWVITDDDSLGAGLSQQLKALRNCDVGIASPSEWLAGEVPAERPQWILFDLRSTVPFGDELWHDLANARNRSRHLPGASLGCLAIVDGGIPIESAKVADLYLAGYVQWPADSGELQRAIEDAERQPERLQAFGEADCHLIESDNHAFRTYSPTLFPLLKNLERAAKHDFTILIVGETGTGKTTLAAMIHELSTRRDERFLPVACGALPGDLIDSELFGHVRGAFTGAEREKCGKFEAAGKGTVLLDEIDVLGLLQQAKLLRVLETGEFEPIGSNETRHSDCRTIVASNVSLESLMDEQQFRSDLYYRLNQVKFEIPPLRDRPRDIVPLAVDFIDQCRQEHGLQVDRIDPNLLQTLCRYQWPGNIRELRNEVRRCVLFHQDGIVTAGHLSMAILQQARQANREGDAMDQGSSLANDVALTERDTIEQMLKQQNFNRAATARALGISRVTLYNKIRKYRIALDEK